MEGWGLGVTGGVDTEADVQREWWLANFGLMRHRTILNLLAWILDGLTLRMPYFDEGCGYTWGTLRCVMGGTSYDNTMSRNSIINIMGTLT
jgi:hypothetical protein